MWWLWLGTAWGLEWRAQLGGEINAAPFGLVELGVREPRWSLQLFTDTLDIRATPHWQRGRGWMGARSEFGAAGLFLSPWTDGRPDPQRALTAFYSGGEGGLIHYLRQGLYVGGQASLRYWLFGRLPRQTRVDVPEPRPVISPDLLLGIYRDEGIDVWVRAGLDWQPGRSSPHVHVKGEVIPDWVVSPQLVVHAGIAHNQDEITKTRVGGLSPYVVPLAGAGFGEWWVEDYLALHAGPAWCTERSRLGVAADVAFLDGTWVAGFEGRGRITDGRRFAELAVGYAPWIPRPDSDGRTSVFFQAGWDWGSSERKPRNREVSPR